MPRKSASYRRKAILAAVRDIFAAGGYAGTRLEDVALRAGISKATLYLYFADKAALFRAMIHWLLETNLPDILPLKWRICRHRLSSK